ncbi:MAG: SGNH/GDSL hydrolase family protein [Clostridia bacterium]|jgi:hypothetical protein|nr:hypothetical protein [Clostridiaceae bacterium]
MTITDDIKKEITLPEKIYAVEGMELNIYLSNLFLPRPDLFCIDVVSEQGVLMDKYWRYIPGKETETEVTVAGIDYDANILNGKSCKVLSCNKSDMPQKKIKCLFIGDSLTQQGTYTQQFLNLCTATGLDMELIGTRGYKYNRQGMKDNVHEGYGGWSLRTHFEDQTSPFVFDGKFDFERYMVSNGFDKPDFVFFFLGPNDIIRVMDDAQMIELAEYNCATYDKIIDNIHRYDKDIHIGICTMLPPSSSQDAFGCSYGPRFKRYRYIRNVHYYNLYMLHAFDGGKYDNVGIVPLHVMFDAENNVSYDYRKPNARSKEFLHVQNNAVHPIDDGYALVADGFYFYVRNMLSQK